MWSLISQAMPVRLAVFPGLFRFLNDSLDQARMTTQNCVSMSKISQVSARDAPIPPRDLSAQASSDDIEKTPGVPHVSVQYGSTRISEPPFCEEESMAVTTQMINSTSYL